MVTIRIENVSEESHAILARRAAEAGQSLQEYLHAVLERFAALPTAEEVLARISGRGSGQE